MSIDILERIDKLRIKKNWSLYELAENSLVPQSTISNMFLRKTLPSITTLEKICSALQISMSEFFVEDEEMFNKLKSLEFLNSFNGLSAESKSALLKFLETLKKDNQ